MGEVISWVNKMEKLISIDTTENFTIKLLNHNLFVINDYLIYHADFIDIPKIDTKFEMRKITFDNVCLCSKGDFSMARMHKYLKEKADDTEGFLFFDGDEAIGYLWIMYRGGNHFQYRVRNIDALIYQIDVFPEFRGHGACGVMMRQAFNYLQVQKRISDAYWSVRKNNISAIRAYDKLGAKQVDRKIFLRVLKVNIPYHRI